MLIAVRSFTTQYDGREVEVIAGVTRIDAAHDLADEFPDAWTPEPNPHANGRTLEGLLNRARERSTPRRSTPARPRLPLEAELRLRRERLAELEARERERPAAAADAAEDVFWRGVDALLESSDPVLARQRREDREGTKLMDELDALQARNSRAEVEELSSWLDPG